MKIIVVSGGRSEHGPLSFSLKTSDTDRSQYRRFDIIGILEMGQTSDLGWQMLKTARHRT